MLFQNPNCVGHGLLEVNPDCVGPVLLSSDVSRSDWSV
jgi:hypothetical protein